MLAKRKAHVIRKFVLLVKKRYISSTPYANWSSYRTYVKADHYNYNRSAFKSQYVNDGVHHFDECYNSLSTWSSCDLGLMTIVKNFVLHEHP